MNRQPVLLAAGLALAATALTVTTARADRRPPYGMDAILLETQVRETIERRITPLLEQMAPGQAELKYVDVRVNSADGAARRRVARLRGDGAGRGVRRREGRGLAGPRFQAAAAVPQGPQEFDKNRLEGLAVPIEIRES